MADFTMDAEHRPMALDRGVQGLLGGGVDRYDGPPKVTGTARYSAENNLAGLSYGVAITAPVGAGRVLAIDTAAAEALPGVVAIYAGDAAFPRQTPVFGQSKAQRYDGTIDSWGEIVGLAVADTFEAARAAARAVEVRCEAAEGLFHTLDGVDQAEPAPEQSLRPDVTRGDIDQAMREAPVTLDLAYSTPRQIHAAMEPHGTVAHWDGDALTLHAGIQIFKAALPVLAGSLDVDAEGIRILSPFIGGAFGGKNASADALLAALAAKRLGRPVKVVMERRQLFHTTYGRSDTFQRLRLAADTDGRLVGCAQDSVVSQKKGASSFEPVAIGAVPLYGGEHRSFTTRIVKTNLVSHGPVRAPGEAVGMIGLECAMDELAEELGLDPIELRRRNEPAADPTSGKPFATRRLLECYDEGARRFGWDARAPTPGGRREGEWLVGLGMAAAIRANYLQESSARVRLERDGRAVVETDMTDLGTGTFTVLAQVAGEALGLPLHCVELRVADSRFPRAAGSGGSFGANSSASSVALACEDVVAELARRMDTAPEEMTLKDGHAIAGNRRVPLADLVGDAPIEALGTIRPGAHSRRFSQAAHGAQFAEVWVNAVTGEARVKRMLGVFECGRVLNAKTARSQAIGGMIWGLGYALHEEALFDRRTGACMNRDFAEYHIPVNADVPQIEAYFIEEVDRVANPVGAKGLGELGISGAGAAVANAVYNACGVRVRDFPITCDKLLAGLPPV